MRIEKAKLPKGMCYPVRATVLEAALVVAGVSIDTHIVQGGSSKLFEGFFWPPNPNVSHERLYIRTAAVPSACAHQAQASIENSVIPEFTAWIKALLALPPNSTVRREEQYFERSLS
jgi:hypothetical protein